MAGRPLLQLLTAQAEWWNIPNLSQPNPGPRPSGSRCRHSKTVFGQACCTGIDSLQTGTHHQILKETRKLVAKCPSSSGILHIILLNDSMSRKNSNPSFDRLTERFANFKMSLSPSQVGILHIIQFNDWMSKTDRRLLEYECFAELLLPSQVSSGQLREDVPVEEGAQDEALRARRPLEVRFLRDRVQYRVIYRLWVWYAMMC